MDAVIKEAVPKISAEEIQKRQEINDWVVANNRLEGIEPAELGSFEDKLTKQWINGEITLDEKLEEIKKYWDKI